MRMLGSYVTKYSKPITIPDESATIAIEENNAKWKHVERIVGRCHVADSNAMVIRFVISKFQGGMKAFKTMPGKDQRVLVEVIKAAHAANQNLYSKVMAGAI